MPIISKRDGDRLVNPTQNVVIRHQRVTVICNDASVLDAGGAEFGVRGHDGCNGLRLEGLTITNAGHGTRITGARDVVIVGCEAHHNRGEGFQGGGLTDLTVEATESHENGWQDAEGDLGIPRHACHGLYFEGAGVTLRQVRSWENDGCGVHCRGSDWLLDDCNIEKNLLGTGVGAPDLQLTSVQGAKILRCYVGDGNAGVTLYNENGPCRDVTAEDCAIWSPAGKHAVNGFGGSVLAVLGGLVCGRLVGTSPRFASGATHYLAATAEAQAALEKWEGGGPEPEPEPPPDLAAENALLKADNIRLRTLLGDIEILAGQR